MEYLRMKMYVRVDISHVLCEMQWLDASLSFRPVETTARRVSASRCPFGALLKLNGAPHSVSIYASRDCLNLRFK